MNMVATERFLAWNGVRLSIAASWEPRVAGPRHLILEEDFQPLLQLRWYKASDGSSRESMGLAAALAKQGETAGMQSDWSTPWRQLESMFQVHAFAAGKDGTPSGGAFSCPQCHTIFHFQLFPDKLIVGRAIAESLATLSCHDHDDDLWRIQDFSLSLPPGFDLVDYSFAAGLTRLSFRAGKLHLAAARLAPADERLKHQSLAGILLAQAGVDGLQIRAEDDPNTCEAFRIPHFFNRLVLRLRGDRPFVQARICHDPACNRLLSLILSGTRPLPAGLLEEIAEHYATV